MAITKFVSKYIVQIAIIIVILIALLLTILYQAGYRVGPGLTTARVGILEVVGLPKNASIYTDEALRGTTSTATSSMKINLVAGTHTVIVSVPNDYPWSENVAINSGTTTTISPIIVSTTLSGTPLTGSEKTEALAVIASTTIPTMTQPLMLGNGCALVYLQDNQIIERPATTSPSCSPPPYLCVKGTCSPTIILAPRVPVTAILPFPRRQDSIIIEIAGGFYALALDPTTPQFFAPIGSGKNPRVGELPDGTIVVEDGNAVSSLSF